MKKNTGPEEERARDLFYALWIPDLFMKRVEADLVSSISKAINRAFKLSPTLYNKIAVQLHFTILPCFYLHSKLIYSVPQYVLSSLGSEK